MIRLLLSDILKFHEQLDKATGIRDIGLIEVTLKVAASKISAEEFLAWLKLKIS